MKNYSNEFDQWVEQAGNNLLTAPILHKLEQMENESLQQFFSQLYYFVDVFPKYLGLILWKVPSNHVRFAIVDNLVDECGGIEAVGKFDFTGIHSQLLRQFIESILPQENIAPMGDAVKNLIGKLDDFFLNSSPVEILGAMACMEGFSSRWFELLYSQLKARKQFSPEELYFFELHTTLDDEHGSILKEVLLPLLKDDETAISCQKAISRIVSTWLEFYQQLATHLQKPVELA